VALDRPRLSRSFAASVAPEIRRKTTCRIGRRLGRFSIEEPQKFFSVPPKLKFNSDDWANRLRKLSAEFSKYPGALNSVVAVEGRRVFSTLVTTEGTQLEHGRLVRPPVGFGPRKGRSTAWIFPPLRVSKRTTRNASERRRNPGRGGESRQESHRAAWTRRLPIPSWAPPILSGRASGVFFHEIFGHRVEGTPPERTNPKADFHEEREQECAARFSLGDLRSHARIISARWR
jgi:hypothetical protein